MQNLLKTSIFSLVFLSITLGIYALNFILPQKAHQRFEAYLRTSGLSARSLPEPETKIFALYYKNVNLDEHGINTIDHLLVRYSLINLLINRRFDEIVLNGLYFDIEPQSILYQSRILSSKTLPPLPFQSLIIKNMTLGIFLENIGALSLTGEINVQKQDETWATQISLDTKQKTLSAHIKAQGNIHNKGYAFDLEFDRGKLLFPDLDLKMTRISGVGEIISDLGAAPHFSVSVQAGGALLQDTPWQNVALTIDKSSDKITALSTAKSIGTEGLEAQFNSEFDLATQRLKHEGSIFSPTTQLLHDYLQIESENVPDISNLTVHFAQNYSGEVFYGLTDSAQTIRQQQRFDGNFNLWALLDEALQTLATIAPNADQNKNTPPQ